MNAKVNLCCFHCFLIAAFQVGLATGSAAEFQPVAASNGREYLVVWKHSPLGSYDARVLMGARVSTNGAVLPPGSLVITTNMTGYARPGVASLGDGFFVVWTDDRAGTNAYDIYGARISDQGALLDPKGIAVCTATNAQGSPQVARCGDNCLVVWEDETNVLHRHNIYGARVDPTGAVLDPTGIPICVAPGDELGPVVAATTNCALVVWDDDRLWGLYGARVDASGVVLETNGSPILEFISMPFPYAVAACQTNFLVAMEQIGDPMPSYALYAVRVSEDGAVLGSLFPITNPYIFGDAISLVGGADQFLFASSGYFPVQSIISAVRIACDGSVLDASPRLVSSGNRDKANASCAALGDDFLVVWEDYRHSTAGNAVADVYAARLSGDGSVLDGDGLWLTPPPSLKITVLENTNPPVLRLSFAGTAGGTYCIQASSNLLSWETLGAAIATLGGEFLFDEPSTAMTRFYRVKVQ